jgi:hypothetical protein
VLLSQYRQVCVVAGMRGCVVCRRACVDALLVHTEVRVVRWMLAKQTASFRGRILCQAYARDILIPNHLRLGSALTFRSQCAMGCPQAPATVLAMPIVRTADRARRRCGWHLR